MSWPGLWRRGDLLPAAVVGLVVFQLVRTCLVERYRVTSRSMEPTLHGDPDTGDIVLVDRLAWAWHPPSTWDVVVLRNRDDPSRNHLVKRVVAVGPQWVEFDGGDVFVGGDRQRLERLEKHPVVHRDLRLVHAAFAPPERTDTAFLRADGERWSVGADGIELRPVASLDELRAATTTAAQDARDDAYLPGHLGLAAAVDGSFFDAVGARVAGGGAARRDIGLDLEVVLDPGAGALQLVHEFAEAYFSLEIDLRAGEGRHRFYGEERARFAVPRLDAGRPVRLEFGRLDGRLFLVVDGTLVWQWPCELPRDSRLVVTGRPRLDNSLHVGVAGRGGLRIRRLVVFQDSHYAADNREPYHVEAGQLFVLGDNAAESADSRERWADPFELDDLVGRPCAIIGPRGRVRLLGRYPEGSDRVHR